MKINIISYLPNDNRRAARLEAHKKQLNWIKTTFPDWFIRVVTQNYREEDFSSLVDEYIRVDEPIGPAGARNLILKKFYNSSEDFTIILDDDTIVKDYNDYYTLLRLIDQDPSICELDMFTGLIMRNCGFRYIIFKDIERHENNFVFQSTPTGIPFLVLRNLKKYHNKEIYFRDYFNRETQTNSAHEDIVFNHDMIYNGMKIAICTDLVLSFLDKDVTTISTESKSIEQVHLDITVNTKKELEKIFGPEILDHRAWLRQHNVIQSYKIYDISRPEKYTFEKELIGWRTKYIELKDKMYKRYNIKK